MSYRDYDDGYDPTSGPQILPGLDLLPDGHYTFLITKAIMKNPPQPDVELILLVKETNQKVQWPHFLNHQVAVNIFGADCCTLGFRDLMGPGCKPSQGIPQVVPRLVGVHFRGEKWMQTDKKDGKKYAKLRVEGRIDGPPPVAQIPEDAY